MNRLRVVITCWWNNNSVVLDKSSVLKQTRTSQYKADIDRGLSLITFNDIQQRFFTIHYSA